MKTPIPDTPEQYDLEDALPYLVNRAGVRIGEAFGEELTRFGITLQMWRVLSSLMHRDAQRITELASHTSIELSTLSRVVAAMDKAGLLERTTGPGDGRVVVSRLTAKGHKLCREIIPLAEVYERVALAGVSASDALIVKRVLARVYENLAAFGVDRRAKSKSSSGR